MPQYVGAIHHGRTATRFVILDRKGRIAAVHAKRHRGEQPVPGRDEVDPTEIWSTVRDVVARGLRKSKIRPSELAAIGVTARGGAAMVWDRATGRPVGPALGEHDVRATAIVEELARDGGRDRLRPTTGSMLDARVPAAKLRWILEQDGVRDRADRGELCFGTMESWIVWNLTGGPDGGVHVTDVSNAAATSLMDIRRSAWDDRSLETFAVPAPMLPRIVPTAAVHGTCADLLGGVPVASAIADLPAEMFGQMAFDPGDAVAWYGDGCEILLHAGDRAPEPSDGLRTTIGWRIGAAEPVYCLEGAVPHAARLFAWLRDTLGVRASDLEDLARRAENNGGVSVVPMRASSEVGSAPVAGAIAGITDAVTRANLARAALEATAWQVREVVDAMRATSGLSPNEFRVAGPRAESDTLLQLQADALGVTVARPRLEEAAARGAAYAAGLAVGVWASLDDLRELRPKDATFGPSRGTAEVAADYDRWRRTVAAQRV